MLDATSNRVFGRLASLQSLAMPSGMSAFCAQFERRAQHWIAVDARVLADQQKTADFYLDAGLLKQRLEVANTFDTEFVFAT